MTDKLRQAAEMALEALEDVQDMMTTSDWFNERVQAVRQALEQPEQEPVAFYVYEWRNPDGSSVFRSFRADEHQFGRAPDSVIPVPAQLPKQEFVCSTGLCHYKHWVGLTNEEIVKASIGNVEGEHMLRHSFARAIEKLLREKNHG